MSEHEEDFAAMFEASEKARQFKRGQQIQGTIVAIGPKVAFIDIGGKGEAEIDVAELKDADGDIEVSVGERIAAMVVSTSGGITLSRRGVRNAATQRELEDAFRSGLAVEGKVMLANKGGYEVRVARERAFCPLSQIDIVRTEDPEVHVGKTYAFRVIEYKNGGKDVVLSRRKLLEDEQRAHAAEARKAIVPGAVITGRVASVVDFGAFVDLGGGVQGLLHVSEMGWSRVSNPNEVVAPGDQVTVKVLRVDDATQKISLGLKQLQDDPWSTVSSRYAVGQVYRGRVSRIADFGVFIELEPEFTGLIPAAETGVDRNMDLRKAFQVGASIDVVV
ncbi:MAG TPA: S1 RNA-binding domain-containing protein, partial [Vicinamibacterales bacterium]